MSLQPSNQLCRNKKICILISKYLHIIKYILFRSVKHKIYQILILLKQYTFHHNNGLDTSKEFLKSSLECFEYFKDKVNTPKVKHLLDVNLNHQYIFHSKLYVLFRAIVFYLPRMFNYPDLQIFK